MSEILHVQDNKWIIITFCPAVLNNDSGYSTNVVVHKTGPAFQHETIPRE